MSPVPIAIRAPASAYEPSNEPRALAPPAMSRARAAGSGSPTASRNTAANSIEYPWRASPEIHDSMSVIDFEPRSEKSGDDPRRVCPSGQAGPDEGAPFKVVPNSGNQPFPKGKILPHARRRYRVAAIALHFPGS